MFNQEQTQKPHPSSGILIHTTVVMWRKKVELYPLNPPPPSEVLFHAFYSHRKGPYTSTQISAQDNLILTRIIHWLVSCLTLINHFQMEKRPSCSWRRPTNRRKSMIQLRAPLGKFCRDGLRPVLPVRCWLNKESLADLRRISPRER